MIVQGECEKCEDRGDHHGLDCIVRRFIFNKYEETTRPSRAEVMEAAVLAVVEFMKRDNNSGMSCEIIPFEKPKGRKMLPANQDAQQLQAQAKADLSLIMEKVLLAGDLSKMEPKDRITYYLKTCESLGMNFLTKPFDLITLNGKMVLYPNRSGTDQLRKIGNVDIQVIDKHFDKDTGSYVVTARAKLPSGRADEDMGVVYCAGLKGNDMANAQLKAMTKAKRRVTLSIMGLGWVDESEVSSIKNAKTHKLDLETGNVIDDEPKQKSVVAQPQVGGDEPQVLPPENQPEPEAAAMCCGREMMISKYEDRQTGEFPLYCPSCKAKKFKEKKTQPSLPKEFNSPEKISLKGLFGIAKSKGLASKEAVKDWIENTFSGMEGSTIDFKKGWSITELTEEELNYVCAKMNKISPGHVIAEAEKAGTILPLENSASDHDVPWAKYRSK